MKLDSNNFSSRIHSQTTTYLAIRIQPVISVSTYFNLALGVLDNFFSYTSAIAVQDQQCFFGFYSSILLMYPVFDRHNKINSSTNMHVTLVMCMIISWLPIYILGNSSIGFKYFSSRNHISLLGLRNLTLHFQTHTEYHLYFRRTLRVPPVNMGALLHFHVRLTRDWFLLL